MGKRLRCCGPPPQGLSRTARQTAPREPGQCTRLRTGATPARARTTLPLPPPPPPPTRPSPRRRCRQRPLACPPRAAHPHHSARWLRMTCAVAPMPGDRAQARCSRGPPRCAPNCAGRRSSSPSARWRGGTCPCMHIHMSMPMRMPMPMRMRMPRHMRMPHAPCSAITTYGCLVGPAHHRPVEHPGAVALGAHLAAIARGNLLARRARGGAVVRAARVVGLAVEPSVANHVRRAQRVGAESVVQLRAGPRRGAGRLRAPCGVGRSAGGGA